MKLQRVLLSRIDTTTEGWDKFIFEKNPAYVDRLAMSLKRVGQVYPLILLKDTQWMYVIAGYGKYLALKKLGVEEAWARIFQENEITLEQALWLALEEKAGRIIRPEAQQRVFRQFHDIAGYPVDKLAAEVAPALGLEPSAGLVMQMLGQAAPKLA